MTSLAKVVRKVSEQDLISKQNIDILSCLNDALQRDPQTIANLVRLRLLCNDELADHPTITVMKPDYCEHVVGLVGIINGILEAAGLDKIMLVYQNDKLVKFETAKFNNNKIQVGEYIRN